MKASGHQWAWLHLTPRLDAHFSQIGFAETGFRIKLVCQRPIEPML
jgi:hypothetical protein